MTLSHAILTVAIVSTVVSVNNISSSLVEAFVLQPRSIRSQLPSQINSCSRWESALGTSIYPTPLTEIDKSRSDCNNNEWNSSSNSDLERDHGPSTDDGLLGSSATGNWWDDDNQLPTRMSYPDDQDKELNRIFVNTQSPLMSVSQQHDLHLGLLKDDGQRMEENSGDTTSSSQFWWNDVTSESEHLSQSNDDLVSQYVEPKSPNNGVASNSESWWSGTKWRTNRMHLPEESMDDEFIYDTSRTIPKSHNVNTAESWWEGRKWITNRLSFSEYDTKPNPSTFSKRSSSSMPSSIMMTSTSAVINHRVPVNDNNQADKFARVPRRRTNPQDDANEQRSDQWWEGRKWITERLNIPEDKRFANISRQRDVTYNKQEIKENHSYSNDNESLFISNDDMSQQNDKRSQDAAYTKNQVNRISSNEFDSKENTELDWHTSPLNGQVSDVYHSASPHQENSFGSVEYINAMDDFHTFKDPVKRQRADDTQAWWQDCQWKRGRLSLSSEEPTQQSRQPIRRNLLIERGLEQGRLSNDIRSWNTNHLSSPAMTMKQQNMDQDNWWSDDVDKVFSNVSPRESLPTASDDESMNWWRGHTWMTNRLTIPSEKGSSLVSRDAQFNENRIGNWWQGRSWITNRMSLLEQKGTSMSANPPTVETENWWGGRYWLTERLRIPD
jgi:hypothetical protein